MHALRQPNQLLLTSYLNRTHIHIPFDECFLLCSRHSHQTSKQLCTNDYLLLFSLTDIKTQYSTFSRAVLAIYLVIKHFRHILEGKHFIIFTSHKPLTQAMHSNSQTYNTWEIRYLDFVSHFTTHICFVKGQQKRYSYTMTRSYNYIN